ncbi:MAG: phosphotransferase family protein [Acidobacteriota bacterium]
MPDRHDTPPLDAADGPALDRAAIVREPLDEAALAHYLPEVFPEDDGPLRVEQFPGGYSNLTYLLRWGDRRFVLRRPPHGAQIATAHDMVREYRMLIALDGVYPCVPKPIALCIDEDVLGAPFYLMERVEGVILRTEPPAGLALTPAVFTALSQAATDQLAALHALDVDALDLGDLGRPDGYVARQIGGWAKRWQRARTDDIPAIEAAFAWLVAHQPAESGASLIHNDYKYDNLVLDPDDLTQIRALLDWEMATIGDPLMDVGTSLAYWAEARDPGALRAFGLTALPGNLDRTGVWTRYCQQRGLGDVDPLFYFVYGLVKVATIAQQIYARFQAGVATDPRFAALGHVIRAAGVIATRALETGRISNLFDDA